MVNTRNFLLYLFLVCFINGNSQKIKPYKSVFRPGENIVVEYEKLPDGAWISLARPNDAVNKYIGYKYSKSSIGIISFDPQDAYGEFEIRLYLTKDYVIKDRQTIRLGNIDPNIKIRTVKNVYPPGEKVQIEFSGVAGTSSDWVAISKAGAPETSYGDWEYTKGQQSGVLQFKSPGPSGNYEARVYFNNEKIVKAKYPFRVGNEDSTIKLSTGNPIVYPKEKIIVDYSGMPGNSKDWISIAKKNSSDIEYIAYKYTEGVQAGKMEFDGLERGEYEVRAYINNETTVAGRYKFITGNPDTILEVKTQKPVFKSNEEIVATFRGFPGNKNDWISIARKKDPDNKYIKYYYTGTTNAFINFIPLKEGLYQGSVRFAGQPPGIYEIRGYFNGEYYVRSRFEFEVVPEKKDPNTVEVCGKQLGQLLFNSLNLLNEIISSDRFSKSDITSTVIYLTLLKNDYASSHIAAFDEKDYSEIMDLFSQDLSLKKEKEDYSSTIPPQIIERIKKLKQNILDNLNKKKIKCPKYLDISLIDEINARFFDFANTLDLAIEKKNGDNKTYQSNAINILNEIKEKLKLIKPCLSEWNFPDLTPYFSLLEQNKLSEASVFMSENGLLYKFENALAESPCCCSYTKEDSVPLKNKSINKGNFVIRTLDGKGEKVYLWIGYNRILENGNREFMGSWPVFDTLYLPPGNYEFRIGYPIEQLRNVEIKSSGLNVLEITNMGRLIVTMANNASYYIGLAKLNEKGEEEGITNTYVNSSIDLPEGNYKVVVKAPSGDIIKNITIKRQSTTTLKL